MSETTTETVRATAGVRAGEAEVRVALPTLRDTAGVQASVSTHWYEAVHEQAGVRANAAGTALHLLRDAAGVRARTEPRAWITRVVRDRAGVTGRGSGLAVYIGGIEEKGGARVGVSEIRLQATYRDSAGGRATAHATSTARVDVQDRVGVSPRLWSLDRAFAHDVAGVQATGWPASDPAAFARAAAGVRSATYPHTSGRPVIRVVAGARSRAIPAANTWAMVRDRAFVHATAYPRRQQEKVTLDKLPLDADVPLSDTDAWTADLRSWGMSRYVRLPVTEMAGTRFGLAPDGVYTTDGAAEFSYIETGRTDLSLPEEPIKQLKRLNYVYTYSVHERPLRVRVTADHRGRQAQYVYQQDSHNSEATRAVRCAVGRGFATNYLQLRVGGPAFDLAQLEVEITPTGRRI